MQIWKKIVKTDVKIKTRRLERSFPRGGEAHTVGISAMKEKSS